MSFHLGKPILAMMLVAALSGAAVALRSDRARADLVVWVFAKQHADAYRKVIPEFERKTKKSVDLHLISSRALNERLTSLFMADLRGPLVPDLVELEINDIGKFFRPAAEDVGLLPLDAMLDQTGLRKRLVPERLELWSKDGHVFGIPHDVHPVSITYRKDLFDEAGIDLSAAGNWDEFQKSCVAFQEYWRNQGVANRHAMELPKYSPDCLLIMLLQQRVNLVDGDGSIHLADPRVARTVTFYAQLVAGPRSIGGQAGGGMAGWAADLERGNLCALFTADWRVADIRQWAPGLPGKLRMMPLPVFGPNDSPTATWGGTMMGIPRSCPRPGQAWELLQYLYFSPEGLAARQEQTHILPPLPEAWQNPVYRERDAFFGGQPVDQEYIKLAEKIPPRRMTSATAMAQAELAYVQFRAVRYCESRGTEGLEEACQVWLAEAEKDLRQRIAWEGK